jgi:hypothetical protein
MSMVTVISVIATVPKLIIIYETSGCFGSPEYQARMEIIHQERGSLLPQRVLVTVAHASPDGTLFPQGSAWMTIRPKQRDMAE